jgi:hypothetical protein
VPTAVDLAEALLPARGLHHPSRTGGGSEAGSSVAPPPSPTSPPVARAAPSLAPSSTQVSPTPAIGDVHPPNVGGLRPTHPFPHRRPWHWRRRDEIQGIYSMAARMVRGDADGRDDTPLSRTRWPAAHKDLRSPHIVPCIGAPSLASPPMAAHLHLGRDEDWGWRNEDWRQRGLGSRTASTTLPPASSDGDEHPACKTLDFQKKT